jgi:chromatin remodeling complex protein RSC6
MSTSTKQTKTTKRVSKKEKVVEPVVEQPVVQVTEQVSEAPKTKAPRVKKTKAKVEVQESAVPVVEQPVSQQEEEHSDDKKQRVRRHVSRESLDQDFESLQKRIEEEIQKLRQNNEKVKGVKFLRSLNKAVKSLHTDCSRVLKTKTKSHRVRSTTSGFMKPVRISGEMSTFTGWDVNQLYSRVDVTKFICKYIRENKLQDSKDRRQILCDESLKNLLKYDPNTASEPLTYFRLQQYIQKHFIKEEVEEEEVDVEEEED